MQVYLSTTYSLILHYCDQNRRWMDARHPVLRPGTPSAEVRGKAVMIIGAQQLGQLSV